MKTVLLTGGSGAVGSAVVPVLLEDPALRLVLLLRPSLGRSVEERFEALKKYWAGYGLADSVWDRVAVVAGDVSLDQLGLASKDYTGVLKKITHIIHGAAQGKLNMDAATARRSSVSTTVHILRLAEEASSLEKLEYLSTVGVAGTLRGPISERKIDEPRTFHNTYESSKAEAELVVWEAMGRGLPVTIHRPSMVVGDSRDGRTLHFQVFYHLMEFLSGRATGGWVPRLPHFRLDVVPNDYVARALAASIRNPGWAGQVLHLSAGRDGSWPLDRYVETLPVLFSAGGFPTKVPHRFSWPLFRLLVPLSALVGPAHRRMAFRHLPRFLSYLKEETFFDNQNARRLLGATGVPLPPLGGILPGVIRTYLASRSHSSGKGLTTAGLSVK